MAREKSGNGSGNGSSRTTAEAFELKVGLAEMLKGGVIMDVTDPEQAKIAEEAGACAVMALERVPADIRRDGGVARMSCGRDDRADPALGLDPGHGEGAHRPRRRGAGARGAGRRLHRRERGADAGGRREPHRQARLPLALRVRRAQSRRGAAAHRRGRGDDPHQGRSRQRQHRRGRAAPAQRERRDPRAPGEAARGADGRRQGDGRPLRSRLLRARARPAAGPELRRRRHRHAARRGAVPHAGRRGHLRGLGHLQERRSAGPGPGDRARQHPLAGRRRGAAACRGLGEAMAGIEMGTLAESERLANRGW